MHGGETYGALRVTHGKLHRREGYREGFAQVGRCIIALSRPPPPPPPPSLTSPASPLPPS
eukprot:COSAG03_NODE_6018_length_1129_cov_80.624272_2_plen_59_part_01